MNTLVHIPFDNTEYFFCSPDSLLVLVSSACLSLWLLLAPVGPRGCALLCNRIRARRGGHTFGRYRPTRNDNMVPLRTGDRRHPIMVTEDRLSSGRVVSSSVDGHHDRIDCETGREVLLGTSCIRRRQVCKNRELKGQQHEHARSDVCIRCIQYTRTRRSEEACRVKCDARYGCDKCSHYSRRLRKHLPTWMLPL
ncbi:hypothetical protein DAEQUDRAFT_91560 [Daedalea quercina L-15889]|uniref:Uncharacterized protein n=1 Tax=Daedalea quercina L-15889 TaxID=1314783 RepID=A0A165S8F5_9APHY|nr:hypothetical protein DAEQUDRAFT_91560 [Daedalea quercina L-15889]